MVGRASSFIGLILFLCIHAYGQTAISKDDQELEWSMLTSRMLRQHQFSWHRVGAGAGALAVRTFNHVIIVSTGAFPISQPLQPSQRICLGVTKDIYADFRGIAPKQPGGEAEKVVKQLVEKIAEVIAEELGKTAQRTLKALQLAEFVLQLLERYSDKKLRGSAGRIDAYLTTEAGLKDVSVPLLEIEDAIRINESSTINSIKAMNQLNEARSVEHGIPSKADLLAGIAALRLQQYGRAECF